jgi:hypothetical protein
MNRSISWEVLRMGFEDSSRYREGPVLLIACR